VSGLCFVWGHTSSSSWRLFGDLLPSCEEGAPVYNFNQNAKTANTTFTFNVHGTGSDGSILSNHVNEHFNGTPDGAENFFSFCH
jgi:hypothetical protein